MAQVINLVIRSQTQTYGLCPKDDHNRRHMLLNHPSIMYTRHLNNNLPPSFHISFSTFIWSTARIVLSSFPPLPSSTDPSKLSQSHFHISTSDPPVIALYSPHITCTTSINALLALD